MESDIKSGEPDLRAFFSDTTADYVDPPQPDLYGQVEIRLRTGREGIRSCFLVLEGGTFLHMHRAGGDGRFAWYAVRFEVSRTPLRYCFEIVAGGRRYRYTRRGIRNTVRPADWWHIVPGYHAPAWAEGGVMYQIFVDRFSNGDPSNDVLTGEYAYMGKPVLRVEDWGRAPSAEGYREFYGGDLQGVIDRLDYLLDLGVEAIYLNPIFLSPSSHKYDTQDYAHIDPHFGRIVRDGTQAERYLARVTDPENLEASDRLFARLVRDAHARGIRVILDGVFNHCGSFHRWLDAEGIYERLPGGHRGAFASKKSPYAGYFRFREDAWPSNGTYDAWWDFPTLPKLDYENSEELCRYILEIGRKWVSPPYCADGWRLDVAADLSYSPAFNHAFWRRFYRAVKEANPEAIILAENYADSQDWLQGGEWDTIMNYEFFMEPVTWFLTGMEKHSDAREEERYGDPDAFWRAALCRNRDAMPDAPLRISMNELSNHDHSRFLTRTNRVVGRMQTHGTEAALEGVHREVMRQAVLLQMTWTGAPTIYYGDEAGLGGFTDPDNRRTYPWGREDRELLDYHRFLANLRRNSHTLRRGSILRLSDGDGVLAYARFSRGKRVGKEERHPAGTGATKSASASCGGPETYIVLININYIPIDYEADVVYAGLPVQAKMECLLRTGREGVQYAPHRTDCPELAADQPQDHSSVKDGTEPTGFADIPVRDGRIRLTLPPESGFLLRWRGEGLTRGLSQAPDFASRPHP